MIGLRANTGNEAFGSAEEQRTSRAVQAHVKSNQQEVNMLTRKHAAIAAAVVVSLGAGAALAAAAGRPKAAKVWLTVPEAGPDADARCLVDTKYFPEVGRRAERSWLRFRARRLDGTDYTIWMDDPATVDVVDLVQVASFTANGRGAVNYRIDTKLGGTMPFGSTLAVLQGLAMEIRDVNGVAVLVGAVPTPPAPKPHPNHP